MDKNHHKQEVNDILYDGNLDEGAKIAKIRKKVDILTAIITALFFVSLAVWCEQNLPPEEPWEYAMEVPE